MHFEHNNTKYIIITINKHIYFTKKNYFDKILKPAT